ncbi:MAG: hypothetical protein PHI64_08715 [Zoogloea sp.]|uniref:hypothetical protein n=1 Tax=Zoogloea sp. TaxID=49181 RepID=UPI002606BF4F|nr:hypothetical protein [Zoogloea sp.]MDD2989029.1 hypothetical protein [Zoogloea sp.]
MNTQRVETPVGVLFSLLVLGAVAFGVQRMAAQPHVFGGLGASVEVQDASVFVQDDDLTVKIFLHQNAGL